ncbi:MAG: matrixin family metalloprotease [Nitrosomonadales bacterium]|nr:matrixin family metalloprotease [Nitrosomonadales bacterium]
MANLNDQVSAIRDALSLYAAVNSATWNTLNIASDKTAAEEAQIRSALFGDGTLDGALISQILIGTSSANTYPNIHEVLRRLGIPVGTDYINHFHLYLNPPAVVNIDETNHLLADTSLVSPTDTIFSSQTDPASSTATLQTAAQGLLDYALTLITGEELMFTMEVPYVPVHDTPIVLAQAAVPGDGTSTQQPDYLLKTCDEFSSGGGGLVDPAGWLAAYLGKQDQRVINPATINSILLDAPKHGKIISGISNYGRIHYRYDTEPGYLGKDKAIFMAEFEGKRYKIVANLVVTQTIDENALVPVCPPPQLIKVNKKPVSSSSGYDLNSVSVTFGALDGGALGLTNASGITLDTNAANYNWYIDTTPGSNEEYLPTSNPYEWVAKAGSAAEGKMDMLSVLLHEYGHALGIDHSTDGHDYMATTLTPGVRRMPSAEEMALMQQLVAQAKGEMVATFSPSPSPASGRGWPAGSGEGGGLPLPIPLGAGFGVAFIGRMRRSSYGGTSIDVVGAPTITQYAVAANATFANLATPAGWNTQGSVDIASGTATLSEVSSRQTRLSQVFMLGEQDRYLSLTVTAVNDAPVAADVALSTAEDTALAGV